MTTFTAPATSAAPAFRSSASPLSAPSLATADSTPTFDTVQALLHSRYSCRAFRPQPVARATIEAILLAAQRTASWCNAQPWQLHIASGATADRLRNALQAHIASGAPADPDLPWPTEYRGVYQERRRECGWGLYEALGIAKGDREASQRQAAQNFQLFGAPHVAVITSDAGLGVYGAVDCGAYVSNFLLAAHSLGVGTVAQAALAAYPGVLRDVLDIRADRQVVCAISFGWPDLEHSANHFRTTRADLHSTVHWLD